MRYDFGGAQGPWDDTITIVDIQDYPEYRKETNKFIFGDLTSILNLPEKAEFINMSRVLRYIIDTDKKITIYIINNINYNLAINGVIRLFDYEEYVLPIVDILMNANNHVDRGPTYENVYKNISKYKIIKFRRINYYDDEEPKKWDIEISLQKG